MTLLKTVNYINNSWPVDGEAVTALNSGLDSITAGAIFVAADADNPNYDGLASGSFIECPEGTNIDVQICEDSLILQGSEKDIWHSFWVNPIITDRANLAGAQQRVITSAPSGNKLTIDHYVMEGFLDKGINWVIGRFWDVVETELEMPSSGSSGSTPQTRFNAWSEITIHIHHDVAAPDDNMIEFYINGHRFYQLIGGGISTELPIASARSDFNDISLRSASSWVGVKWRFAGGESWSGVDFPLSPRTQLVNTTNDLQRSYWCDSAYWDTTKSSGVKGLTMAAPTGAITWTAVPFVGGGVNLSTRRYVGAGATGALGQIKTNYTVDALPFNEYGWATVMIRSFRQDFTSTKATFKFALRNVADTEDIFEITVEPTNGRLQQGGSDILDASGNPITIISARYYNLAIHFKNDGTCTMSISNLSDEFNITQNWFSAQLNNWTVQTVGHMTYDVTKGDGVFEFEPALVLRWMTGYLMDSTSNAVLNAGEMPAPSSYAAGNRVANHMGRGIHAHYILGGSAPAPLEQLDGGLTGYRESFVSIGRSGHNMNHFVTNLINNDAFKFTNGTRFIIADGSSINDLTTTYADKAAVDAKLALLQADFTSMMTGLLVGKNSIWLGDMVIRENALYDERSNELQKRYNYWKAQYFYENQTTDLQLEISRPMEITKDVTDVYWSSGDNVHFDDGEETYAANMYIYRTVPPVKASTVTNPLVTDIVLKTVAFNDVHPNVTVSESAVGTKIDFDLTGLIPSDNGAELFELKISEKANFTNLKTITLTRTSDLLYRWSISAGDLTPLLQSGSTRKTTYYGQITGRALDGTLLFTTSIDQINVLKIEVQNVIS